MSQLHGKREGIDLGLAGFAILMLAPLLWCLHLLNYVVVALGLASWIWLLLRGVSRLLPRRVRF